MISFRREKALSRLIELTTDADEEADENAAIEAEAVQRAAEETGAIAHAVAAAVIGEAEASTAEEAEVAQAAIRKRKQ